MRYIWKYLQIANAVFYSGKASLFGLLFFQSSCGFSTIESYNVVFTWHRLKN